MWYDVFGTQIQEFDYILSSASSTGIVKVGYAYYSPRGSLMLKVSKQFCQGREDKDFSLLSAAGTTTVVLKTREGVIPGPVQNLW